MSTIERRLRKWLGLKKDTHFITYNKDVTESGLKKLWTEIIEVIKINPKTQIVLIITSNGGDPDAVRNFYCKIKFYKVNVLGIGVGCVASAALILLLSCRKRFAINHTQFVIHGVKDSACGHRDFSEDDHAEALDELRFSNEIMVNILAENTKISKKKIRAMHKRETNLNVKEARKIGLIHRIVWEGT